MHVPQSRTGQINYDTPQNKNGMGHSDTGEGILVWETF